MKNKIKPTLDNFLSRIKSERDDACVDGFLFGVLLSAVIFLTMLFLIEGCDNAAYKKRCAAVTVEWNKALADVRGECDYLKTQIKNETAGRRLLQNVLFREVDELKRTKADLPKVWNGEKLND